MTVDLESKTLQIGKLLQQASGTTNEHEQDAFFKQAQRLASKYSVDLEIARQKIAKSMKRETPVQKRIDIGEKGKPLNAVFCSLFMDIGRAQDLDFNIAHNSTYVIAFGFPSDIAVTEAMYATVVPQMIKHADTFIKAGSWRGEETWCTGTYRMKPVTSRVARRCFYEAYSERIGQRLREAKREYLASIEDEQVITDDGVTSTALVLANKSVEVSDYYKQTSTARGSWKGNRGNTANSSSSRSGGRNAANSASINGGRAIGGGPKAIG